METQKKFEVGQLWRDNYGDKHMILEIKKDHMNVFDYKYNRSRMYSLKGEHLFEGTKGSLGRTASLVEPWQEPRSGEVWLNIFYDNDGKIEMGSIFTNKSECIRRAEYVKMIARIKMPWKEGQFDD